MLYTYALLRCYELGRGKVMSCRLFVLPLRLFLVHNLAEGIGVPNERYSVQAGLQEKAVPRDRIVLAAIMSIKIKRARKPAYDSDYITGTTARAPSSYQSHGGNQYPPKIPKTEGDSYYMPGNLCRCGGQLGRGVPAPRVPPQVETSAAGLQQWELTLQPGPRLARPGPRGGVSRPERAAVPGAGQGRPREQSYDAGGQSGSRTGQAQQLLGIEVRHPWWFQVFG